MPYRVIVTDHMARPSDGRISNLGVYETWDEVIATLNRIAQDRWGGQEFKTEDPESGYFEVEGIRNVSWSSNKVISCDESGMTKGEIRGEFLILLRDSE